MTDWSGPTIRARRDELGMTQQQLADALDVSLRAVTGWETGEATPRKAGVRARLTAVLGTPPNDSSSKPDFSGLSDAELAAWHLASGAELARRLMAHQGDELSERRQPRPPATTLTVRPEYRTGPTESRSAAENNRSS